MLVDGIKVREHFDHYDDCGCLSARYQAQIQSLEEEVKRLTEALRKKESETA